MGVYNSTNPYRVSLVVGNKLGIHGRPATNIANIAKDFDGRMTYAKKGNDPVDAESVMSVLMQSVLCGESVVFELYPSEPLGPEHLDGIRETVGALENAVAHDDDD